MRLRLDLGLGLELGSGVRGLGLQFSVLRFGGLSLRNVFGLGSVGLCLGNASLGFGFGNVRLGCVGWEWLELRNFGLGRVGLCSLVLWSVDVWLRRVRLEVLVILFELFGEFFKDLRRGVLP
jgi:hypothetical protein